MKNKIFALTLLIVVLSGCKQEEPEVQPVAKFIYSINEKTVSFTNQSLHAKSYQWSFGDGSASSESDPVKTYSGNGSFKVTLTATNITKTSSYSEMITISSTPTPQAKFSYSTNGLTVSFKNQSTNAQTFSWNFGNGQTSTQKEPIITYETGGTYSVSLTATNGDKSNTATQNVTVNSPQTTASFTYKVEHPLKVVLTNTSTNATSYTWDFGDGSSSTEKNPTHRYDGIGVYKIKLTAKGNNQTKTQEKNITIEAPTKCFITGFTIQKIPNENNYYQVQFTDDYIFAKSTYFYTEWYLLSSANVPFHHDLTTEKQLDINKTYVARLYKSASKTSGQADGKGFWTAEVTPTSLGKYPETLTYSDTSAAIQLIFKWQ